MYTPYDEVRIQKILLDVVRYNMNLSVDRDFLNPLNTEVYLDDRLAVIGRELIIRLEHKIASQKLDTIVMCKPKTWFDHLKQDHFPKWFKKRFPVRYDYEEYEVSALYPKIALMDEHPFIQVSKLQNVTRVRRHEH